MVKEMDQVLGGIMMVKKVMRELIKTGIRLMGGHTINEMGQQ